MKYRWKYSADNIDWDELSELYKLAPLGDKEPNKLETAFSNSLFKCFVFEGSKLVAVGRALADGTDCSYICDVAVLPEYQSEGLGKAIGVKFTNGFCVENRELHNFMMLFQAKITACRQT